MLSLRIIITILIFPGPPGFTNLCPFAPPRVPLCKFRFKFFAIFSSPGSALRTHVSPEQHPLEWWILSRLLNLFFARWHLVNLLHLLDQIANSILPMLRRCKESWFLLKWNYRLQDVVSGKNWHACPRGLEHGQKSIRCENWKYLWWPRMPEALKYALSLFLKKQKPCSLGAK